MDQDDDYEGRHPLEHIVEVFFLVTLILYVGAKVNGCL